MDKPLLLSAGAASFDITPTDSQFLFGYPHESRYSTGVHDPLFASALYLCNNRNEQLLFVACDIIFVPKSVALRARRRIENATGISPASIMITATHTHSGPSTVKYLSNDADPIVPDPDENYLRRLEDGIVEAAEQAVQQAAPTSIGLVEADGSCVGTNRRDPAGSTNPRVPVLAVKKQGADDLIALMIVCSMHPTVLHEDSTLASADFPGSAKQYLQENFAGADCPIIFHSGPCGNQSPRHVTRANTFAEADRLGCELARNIIAALANVSYHQAAQLSAKSTNVQLPLRTFPSVEEARANLEHAREKLDHLRLSKALSTEIRTAEVDWFGAEETLALAQAASDGRMENYAQSCMPAEIQVFRVGPWNFVAWQGEIFVEFALQIMQQAENTYVISLANGELQGYLVTDEAIREGAYEANNALFQSPESGNLLVARTLELFA